MKKPVLILVMFGLVVAGPAAMAVGSAPVNAPPANAAECEKAAKEWFGKAYAGGTKKLQSGRTVNASFKAHFSAKRGQCLVRLEFSAEPQGKAPAVSTLALYEGDPADKKSLGSVVRSSGKVVHCAFGKEKCQAVEEWQAKAALLLAE